MEAEADKELAAEEAALNAQANPEPQPASPQPVKQDEPAQAAAGDDAPKANLLGEIGQAAENAGQNAEELARTEQRIRSMMGRLSKEHEDWKRERESYEARIAELESRLNSATTAAGGANATEDEPAGTDFDELRKALGDGYSDEELANFEKAVNFVSEKKLRTIRQKFDDIEAEKTERSKQAAKANADAFVARLDADFPGFRQLDANNDPRWMSFLSTSLGGLMEETTYGDIAKKALANLDYRKFSGVVQEFARAANIVFSPSASPEDGRIDSQERPASVHTHTGSGSNQRKFVPAAEIDAFRRAFFAHKAEGIYGLTPKQVEERLQFYEDAEAEGRVV